MHPVIRILILLVATLCLGACSQKKDKQPLSAGEDPIEQAAASEQALACSGCHVNQHQEWMGSHHALANAKVGLEPFQETRNITSAQGDVSFFSDTGKAVIQEDDTVYHPDYQIGHDPLIQYLIKIDKGRYQTYNIAWDPAKREWFDVFGGEKRDETEWGHWKGGGMNWNANCASCHMTGYHKNYDTETDSYASKWTVQGIDCTRCHSNTAEHAKAPTKVKPSTTPVMDNCLSCHSHREELDNNFKAGSSYHDHYRITLPGTHPHYYPDGQIKEEVFVGTSFLMSRMAERGVTCADCHDSHSGKLTKPVINNELCMQCHSGKGRVPATVIDPEAHSHHKTGSKGNQCVSCHMPETTYMQRDPRRDHGFVIPDPELTMKTGTPNACNGCHSDETAKWAASKTKEWYGDKSAKYHSRSMLVFHHFDGSHQGVDAYLKEYKASTNPLWRASLLNMMTMYARDKRVTKIARDASKDESVDLRRVAARVLAQAGDGDGLLPMLEDKKKAVRLSAAWELVQVRLPEKTKSELEAYLSFVSDHPAGAMKMGQYHFFKGNATKADTYFKRALKKDPLSPGIKRDYALFLYHTGQLKQAAAMYETLLKTENPQGQHSYSLALIYSELKAYEKAAVMLEKTLEAAPGHGRAVYNLALVYQKLEKMDKAIALLTQALERQHSDDLLYLKAFIQHSAGKRDHAIVSLNALLKVNPAHKDGRLLLNSIQKK